MAHGRKHFSLAKPPVTRIAIIKGDCNGHFKIAVEIAGDEFEKICRQWFDDPNTKMWCIESFIGYFKKLYPNRVCLLYDDYEKMTKGKVTHATKEEYDEENN